MEKVFREAVRLLDKREPFVVATVVRTSGSTPQKPGAKLLVRKDGTAVGTLGGGCVEGDIWFSAKLLLKEHGQAEYRDYLLNEDLAAQDGLVCGGTMYFLLDPIWDPDDYATEASAVVNAYEGGQYAAIVNLVKPAGKGKIGDKLFITTEGAVHGSLGDEKRDQEAVAHAQKLAPYGKHEYLAHEDGAESFIETYTAPQTLVIMGGGHIGKCLAPLAHTLGFRIFVVDDRPEFANPERFPEAEQTLAMDFTEGLKQLPINPNTAVVIATRGHRYDDTALAAAAGTPASYVGLVGSMRKGILIYESLIEQGIDLDRLRSIRCPIGLDIGGRTPEEIAVSIMAEIVAFRNNASCMPMKMEDKQIDRLVKKVQDQKAAASPVS